MNGNAPTIADVINGAVGPLRAKCMGYMNPGAKGIGYIATNEALGQHGVGRGRLTLARRVSFHTTAARRTTPTSARSTC